MDYRDTDPRQLPAPPHPLALPAHATGTPGEKNRRPLYLFLIVFAVIFLLVLLVAWIERRSDAHETEQRAKEAQTAKPVVEVATVAAPGKAAGLVVPGTTIPLTEAFVYARANGYLKRRFVDIGDHVVKNQLLATIDAPDLDAQVLQAREQVAQAQQQLEQQRSQLALATVTVNRYRVLVQKGVFSRQDGDQQETNYTSAQANVAAAQRNVDAFKANLAHQIALQSYEQVRSPFTGIITARNVDVGAPISASGAGSGGSGPAPMGQTSSSGGSQQAAQTNSGGVSGSSSSAATSAQSPGQGGPLFSIAQVQRLRVLVSVPEGYASAIHVGQSAPISFQELPGAHLFAEVTRTAESIDANTRTMLTELQIDNTANRLVAGMYAVVTFPPQAAGGATPLTINGDAIVIRKDTSMVAKVVNGKVQYVPVIIGRDFGSAVEILGGLQAGDVIVTDVTDDVREGVAVQTHEDKQANQNAAPPTQSTPPGGDTQYGNQGLTDQNLQGKQSQQNQQSQGKQPNAARQSRSESKQ